VGRHPLGRGAVAEDVTGRGRGPDPALDLELRHQPDGPHVQGTVPARLSVFLCPLRLPPKFAASAISPRPAPVTKAGIPVFDAANFGQTLSTALSTAEHVRQMVQQLRKMEQQLRNEAQTLRSLDPTSFQGLLDSINTITMARTRCSRRWTHLFQKPAGDADLQRLFPRSSPEWADVRSGSFAARRRLELGADGFLSSKVGSARTTISDPPPPQHTLASGDSDSPPTATVHPG
jgi:hypothetical protein